MKHTMFFLALFSLTALGCSGGGGSSGASGGGGATTAPSAEKPSTVVAALSSAAVEAGTGVGASMGSGTLLLKRGSNNRMNADTRCNRHGSPVALDNNFEPILTQAACTGNGYWNNEGTPADPSDDYCAMGQSDVNYPGMAFYCFIAKDTGAPDSLQGAFGGYKNVVCALERSGVTWHDSDPGADDTKTAVLDSSCFEQVQLDDICGSGQTSCTLSGIKVRAIRNPDAYYDTSISLQFPAPAQTFYKSKVKASDGILEISVNNNGGGYAGQNDAYSAKYVEATKTFTYEGRFDRLDSTKYGNGNWSRHYRVSVDLQDSTSNPIPESIEGAISQLYVNGTDADNDGEISRPGEVDGHHIMLTTIRGSMTGAGLTGESYSHMVNAPGTLADALDTANLNKDVTSCAAPNTNPVANACAGVAAVVVPNTTTFTFALPGQTAYAVAGANVAGKYQNNTNWFNALTGVSFTSIDLTKSEP